MEARYSKSAAKLLSLMILIFMIITAASQMVGIGSFFGTYLGLNYEVAILLGTAVVLIYSMFGGFRGVVMTDIIQFVLLLFSAVIVCVVAMAATGGGIFEIGNVAEQLGKTDYMSFTAGADKYLMYVITFGCAWMIQANVWQRISAAKDDKDAQKMTLLSFFAFIPLYLVVVLTGMAGIVLFDKMPEGGIVTAVVMKYMSPLLGAIVFIGISAAIMSTMDSVINTGAMTLCLDLREASEDESENLKFSRIATLIITIIALVIALGVRSILQLSWMASDVITTGVFVPLVAGFFWRRGNSKGAVSSMCVGLLYCLYNLLIYFKVPLPAFWEPQSTSQVVFGLCISLIVYIIVSLLTKPEYDKADKFISKSNILGIKKFISNKSNEK